jgi:hypothetical protein
MGNRVHWSPAGTAPGDRDEGPAMADPVPRVLIETRDPTAASAVARLLRDDGLEAEVCRGPHRVPQGGCPILTDGDCTLVERADVVLFDLDLDDPVEREVLRVARLRYPDKPVVVETPTSAAHRHAADLGGCTVVPPISPEHLARRIVDVLAADRPTVTS